MKLLTLVKIMSFFDLMNIKAYLPIISILSNRYYDTHLGTIHLINSDEID